MPGQEYHETNQPSFSLYQEHFLKVSSKSDEPNLRYIRKYWKSWILGPISPTAPPTFALFALFLENRNFRKKLDNNKTLRFKTFPAKSNDSIFHKSPKTLFFGHFGPKCPNLGRTRFFPKNRALSLFFPYGPLTS